MLDCIKAVTNDAEVGMFIYNAGADSVMTEFYERDLASAERLIALNVTGPIRLAYHFGAGTCERRHGGMIFVGSMAAYAGSVRNTTYAASKAFQSILAEGLWYQLRPYNVHVLALVLSVTRTLAMARLGLKFDAPGLEAADPDDVAQEGLDHLGIGPVWNAASNETFSQQLRSMPRAEVVARSAQAGDAVKGS